LPRQATAGFADPFEISRAFRRSARSECPVPVYHARATGHVHRPRAQATCTCKNGLRWPGMHSSTTTPSNIRPRHWPARYCSLRQWLKRKPRMQLGPWHGQETFFLKHDHQKTHWSMGHCSTRRPKARTTGHRRASPPSPTHWVVWGTTGSSRSFQNFMASHSGSGAARAPACSSRRGPSGRPSASPRRASLRRRGAA
jgi:hypothetical protein